jgi:uncharacterized protein HemX
MKKQIVKFSDLPKMKQMQLRAILERNKPKTRTQIKTKQQSQLKKISKNDYQNWFFNTLN